MSKIDDFTIRAAQRGQATAWLVTTGVALLVVGFFARGELDAVFRAPEDVAVLKELQEAAAGERAQALQEIADLRRTQAEAMTRISRAIEAIEQQTIPRTEVESRLQALENRMDARRFPAAD